MRAVAIAITFLIFSISTIAQFKTSVKRIYSTNVKDSFDIYTSVPVDFSKEKKYDVIYYCDATLKSGIALREQINEDKSLSKKGNYIFIGIGHIGDFHVLRRRDFILPFINGKDTLPSSADYGHIKDFYNFLVSELIPSVQTAFRCTNKRTIIGHSLGGLFVFYCLFRSENTFTNYIALSPALWIDHYRIYEFNKLNNPLPAKTWLYFSAGGLETINQILPGTYKMNEFLTEKKYINLTFEYKVHPWQTHNSQVPESLKYVLTKL
ncbi:MAG TPA: alpha/beta hydrolase-fold protein [Chitinophagaceae bacterium]|nr:alpha/beta hydrolase-fold protein [Chitinophagaceae bacterium]